MDFGNFQVQIAQSPLLSAYAGFISYATIIVELLIVVTLIVPKFRLIGLYSSMGIMIAFTIYIYLILNFSDFVPCSCGGILEKMDWTEHLLFNLGCILLSFISVILVEVINRQKFIIYFVKIFVVFVASTSLVVYLFYSSEYIIKKENNFVRRFLIHPVLEDKSIDLKLDSYYIAGSDSKKIYLGNITAPLLFSEINYDLSNLSQQRIELDEKDYSFKNLWLQTFKNDYFLYDGSVPIIYRGKIGDQYAETISYQNAYFTQLSVLDSARFALRTQSKSTQQYTLGSLDLNRNPKVVLNPDILQKQIDGVFDSDGKLLLNQNFKNLIYIYNYRNEYMIMDEDLELKSRLKTIDTISRARFNVVKIPDGRHKMNVPSLKNNQNPTTNQNLLFVESKLIGKYESKKAWKKNSIIDIYRIDRQEYVGSFYIPKKDDKALTQMYATDMYLFVLIDKELKRYKFTRLILNLYEKGNAENLK
ncbi:tellurium resistance protein TerC [Chryseobacterium gambrini]|nr:MULTISPECIES: MauE/DoxX family redox-associated membrane protein [Chryseobacterium group]MDN4013294.1 tellurium resistance protein TerC [Chryseobacterium gambrini]